MTASALFSYQKKGGILIAYVRVVIMRLKRTKRAISVNYQRLESAGKYKNVENLKNLIH